MPISKKKKKKKSARYQWLMLSILATQEVAMGKIMVKARLDKRHLIPHDNL
jgi:hypothetical protein